MPKRRPLPDVCRGITSLANALDAMPLHHRHGSDDAGSLAEPFSTGTTLSAPLDLRARTFPSVPPPARPGRSLLAKRFERNLPVSTSVKRSMTIRKQHLRERCSSAAQTRETGYLFASRVSRKP